MLIENVVFNNGHGATIGSVPDCNGCMGFVTNVTYRNCSFGGNAPMKIKTWANTTGEISNILFEDCTLKGAASAVEISANYGGDACPCKWFTDYGGPDQHNTKCKNYHWAGGYAGVGGVCGPEGDATNNINIRNITFRRLSGTVVSPGAIDCRRGNPCEVNLEDVNLQTKQPWGCGNAKITSKGTVKPLLTDCPVGPEKSARMKTDDLIQDLNFTDLVRCSGKGGGGSAAPTIIWSPSIAVTAQNTTLAVAQAQWKDGRNLVNDAGIMSRSVDGGRVFGANQNLRGAAGLVHHRHGACLRAAAQRLPSYSHRLQNVCWSGHRTRCATAAGLPGQRRSHERQLHGRWPDVEQSHGAAGSVQREVRVRGWAQPRH